MEKLKIEIEKAAKKTIRDFLSANFDDIVIYDEQLSAQRLCTQIDNVINVDVEEYLMNKACGGKTFGENEEIPEHDLANYQKKFEEYGKQYEALKKQVTKPIHRDYKARVAELREEYLKLEKKYCGYFDYKNDKPEPKSKGVLSLIDKWRKPKPTSDD